MVVVVDFEDLCISRYVCNILWMFVLTFDIM